MRQTRTRLFGLLLGIAVLTVLAKGEASAKGKGKGTGGIPAVLEKLEQIQRQVGDNAALLEETQVRLADLSERLDALDADVEELDGNVTPCTLERFRNGKCGDENRPFNLAVTLCSGIGADADVRADFQINNSNVFELGLGWDSGFDGNLRRNVEFPGIPGLVAATGGVLASGYVYGIPFPNLQAGVNAAGGLALEGCIEIPISIDQFKPEVIALMEHWQARGSDFQDEILDLAARMDLQADRISDSVWALEVFQSKMLSDLADEGLEDPLRIFDQDRTLGNFLEFLPVGDRIRAIQDDPEILVESLVALADEEIEGLPAPGELCDALDDDDRPLLRRATSKLCSALRDLPDFETVATAFEAIEAIPDEVTALMDELFTLGRSGVPFPDKERKSRVCKVFPRLCD